MMLLLGFLLGIFASGIAWLIVRLIVPRIHFVPEISKVPSADNKNGWRYRFQIYNIGKRDIIDLQLECLFYAKISSSNWLSTTIPFDKASSPKMRAGGLNAIYQVFPAKIDIKSHWNFDENIMKKAKDGTILLEDLLSYNETAYLRIYIFGYDAFSGARKLFTSKEYKLNDIKEGFFSGGKYKTAHVEVKENIQEATP